MGIVRSPHVFTPLISSKDLPKEIISPFFSLTIYPLEGTPACPEIAPSSNIFVDAIL
jgi:hypothetical protein